MKIAVDVMGSDKGPSVIIEGALDAAKKQTFDLILVGNEEIIKKELMRHRYAANNIQIRHASKIVEMHESPSQAIRRKRDSSMVKAVELVKSKEADAVVSAGNTGAYMASAAIYIKTIEGIERPAIAILMPALSEVSLLLDVGANVDCSPLNLYQFAIMGNEYSKYILKKGNPKVGLLNIGEEEHKGNDLTKKAYEELKKAPINFVGNIEGRDIFNGEVDVIVCDGFIGNIILKSTEGLGENIYLKLRNELKSSLLSKIGALLSKGAYKHFKKSLDYEEYGGAPFLGINGVCIKAHGNSSSLAIKNSILVAENFVNNRVNEHIKERLKN
ncbi:phosphate acyltransferase PlsX [bacterium]|nr:phosphate acyltransferase PlsX [bacterium]